MSQPLFLTSNMGIAFTFLFSINKDICKPLAMRRRTSPIVLGITHGYIGAFNAARILPLLVAW
jgi:hypothetical protein